MTLILLPLLNESPWSPHERPPADWIAQDMLRVEWVEPEWGEDYELDDLIKALPRQPVPKALSCHFASPPDDEVTVTPSVTPTVYSQGGAIIRECAGYCYGYVTEDAFGEPLTWVTAGDLATVKHHPGVIDSWNNRAVWAYLTNLATTWPIVLFWNG